MLILILRLGVALFHEVFRWEWLYYAGIVALVLFLISLCDELNDRFKRIPFGPMRLPLVGNRAQLLLWGGKRPYAAITRMAPKKGGFLKIFFGLTGYISVNGADTIKQVLLGEEWVGERDELWRLDRYAESRTSTTPVGSKTIVGDLSSMTVWVSRRNIAIRCLKEHILCLKGSLNTLITKQVSELLKGIQSQESVDKLAMREITSDTFLPFIISSVWSVLTGDEKVEVTDRRVQTIHRCLKDWEEKSVNVGIWWEKYPFLLRWFEGWSGVEKLKEVNHDFRKVLKSLIRDQYTKAEKNKINPESFVQACVREFKELRKSSFGGSQLNDSSSIALLFEFLCPGPLMVSSHIAFCLLFAARDPQAQLRIVQELQRAGGGERVHLDKLDEMPYTNAFILEVYRISSIVPFERRKLLKLVRQGETRFPQAMPLLLNYHSANFETGVWEDPKAFNPQRFLNRKETKVINQEKLISLNAERNLCAGEPLLRMILFCFLTETLSKWEVQLHPNWVDKGPLFNGMLNKPHPFRVKLIPREQY